MQRILVIAAVLLAMGLVGCSSDPTGPNTQEPKEGLEEHLILGADQIDSGKDTRIEAALGATYASSLQQIGWSDWIATFYLPYNPGVVTFQGHLISGGQWQTFSGSWAQIWDARYTSSGFRVQILMGARVFFPCGPTTSRYRLLY